VILSYDLEVVPILMRYESHADLELPLEAIDKKAAVRWVDDRLVGFVQTYLVVCQNDVYLRDEMVEDPVAHLRSPRAAAGATLEWQDRKFYFVGEETRREFAVQVKVSLE
jgi:hypothetical protein